MLNCTQLFWELGRLDRIPQLLTTRICSSSIALKSLPELNITNNFYMTNFGMLSRHGVCTPGRFQEVMTDELS